MPDDIVSKQAEHVTRACRPACKGVGDQGAIARLLRRVRKSRILRDGCRWHEKGKEGCREQRSRTTSKHDLILSVHDSS
jgi:hypothetical protein